MKLLHLTVFASTVNCALYWFYPKVTDENGVKTVENIAETVNDLVVPKEELIFNVVLTETVDEEKEQFDQELNDQTRLLAERATANRLKYFASLPKEHDSMEIISEEASFMNRLITEFTSLLHMLNKFKNSVLEAEYGPSQYSDDESDESDDTLYEPFNLIVNDLSSSESDEDAAIRSINGEPLNNTDDGGAEETFEVIDNALNNTD